MSNQAAIARALGLTQATVSRALRNAPEIAAATRQRVQAAARKMGYIPNPMVISLMNRIRDGRGISDSGCIAILGTMPPSHSKSNTFDRQLHGMAQGAEARGFRTEYFYLGNYAMELRKIERILKARGITGLILAPSNSPSGPVALNWPRYACATLGASWPGAHVDRAGVNHRTQMDAVMKEVLRRGYRRIGFCLPPNAVDGLGGAWLERYLYWQYKIRDSQPFPLFVGKPGETPVANFKRWLSKWKIDVVLGLVGHEYEWFDALGLHTPQDIGLACLNYQPDSQVSGMDENHEVVGKTAVEIVIDHILHNEFGLPAHPRLILVEGEWKEGRTLRPPLPSAG